MDETPPLLEARRVWKWLAPDTSRPPALQDVSLTLPAASWSVFTGPSGSGKTTLLSLLGALDRPSRGEVLLEGEDLTRFSDLALARVRRRIGFVFQDFSLLPRLPLWQNVTYPLVPRGIRRAERLRRAEAVLARLGLAGFEGKRPEELSGGERQRVGVARALAGNPDLLIADEPTSNLDPDSAAVVRQVLAELHAAGTTLLIATHDPNLVAQGARVYELRAGLLVSAETRTKPAPETYPS
jgi:putative ABC transport system ATP-binding protein